MGLQFPLNFLEGNISSYQPRLLLLLLWSPPPLLLPRPSHGWDTAQLLSPLTPRPPSPSTTEPMEPTEATAFPWPGTCGSATLMLSPRPTHIMAMAVSTEDMASDTPPSPPASTELLPLDTVCASVMPTPMPTMATEAFMALDMEAMAMVDSTAMARGPLMLRPSQRLMPGTDTVGFTATVLALAMEGMAMVDSTAMERGPLTLTPSHGWDMVDSMAVGPMVSLPSWPTPTAP